jgi:hypothetical protein
MEVRSQIHDLAALLTVKEPLHPLHTRMCQTQSLSWHPKIAFPCRESDYNSLAVEQLVEALRYKPEGRWFDSRWCHWNFSLTQSFRPYYGPGIDSASNRNKYPEYFLGGKGGHCVELTTLPPSRADCLEMLGASTSWNPQSLYRDSSTFLISHSELGACSLYRPIGEMRFRKISAVYGKHHIKFINTNVHSLRKCCFPVSVQLCT